MHQAGSYWGELGGCPVVPDLVLGGQQPRDKKARVHMPPDGEVVHAPVSKLLKASEWSKSRP